MSKVDANLVATPFRTEISEWIKTSGAKPKLVGFLANDDEGARMYAAWTGKRCTRDGIEFELREVPRVDLEDQIIAANEDGSVHGIIVYYPVFGGQLDSYLRDIISMEKDVEGLNHQYRYNLYHNVRHIDQEESRKSILPCTPLAMVKILEHLQCYDKSKEPGMQLDGKVVSVVNRSEVVGRPLAAMLANDGGTVYSIDIDGLLVYSKGRVAGTIRVAETDLSLQAVIEKSDIVISGVPSTSYKIPTAWVQPGAVTINFSQNLNFEDDITTVAKHVPAIGCVTIAMLERNLLRLFQNFSKAQGAES